MKGPMELRVPMACPHCLAGMLPTLEQVQQGQMVDCPRCGTKIALQPDDLPIAATDAPPCQDFLHF